MGTVGNVRATDDSARDLLADCAHAVRTRTLTLSGGSTVEYPVVGSARLAAVTEVALLEATVHLLDLIDAVGGVGPSDGVIEAARDLLVAIPRPTVALGVLAGRVSPDRALPVIR